MEIKSKPSMLSNVSLTSMITVRPRAFISLHFCGTSFCRFRVHAADKGRCTSRLLQSELVKDGTIEYNGMEQLCKVFEGGELHASSAVNIANVY